ncbi:MAG: phosphorylase [Symploca sp. SIO2D2]|nr:phosphorylase [Symploca sp. SIO2D2]
MSGLPINTILVPQGAEYQAVCRGLSQINPPQPQVIAIPIGCEPVTRYLAKWQKSEQFLTHPQPKILLMGLAGSLSPQYHLGDIVLYQDCVYPANQSECSLPTIDRQLSLNSPTLPTDKELTTLIQHHLPERADLVRGLTSDRIIWSSSEKRQLGQVYQAAVVDMEGYAVLEVLYSMGVAVAMLRVISDDCYHDLPDLNCAISPEGKLESLPLAMGMVRQPLAATRLIRGSLKGLRILQQVTASLFQTKF